MALIDVNHKVLREVASAITTYCTFQNREMRTLNTAVKTKLLTGWVGNDAKEFSLKWRDVTASDSTAVKFRESLESYSENLNSCAGEYEKAQTDAYNKANRLPKYIVW